VSNEVIAIDIDEVLFPFVENFVEHDNAIYGGNVSPAQFTSYAFEHVLNISLEESVERVYSFNGVDHRHITPIELSVHAIQKLSEKYDLAVITARHPKFESNTLAWLEHHLPEVFSAVHFIGYAAIMEKPRTKAEVCRELGASTLVDDSLEHVTLASAEGIESVLFGNYPWNQAGELPEGVTRCNDWQEVLEYFDARG
jgi:uncharacterized HAD superfamily protein